MSHIDVIDASSTTGALRAAEEVGWSRGFGAALDILQGAAQTATPRELMVIGRLALAFHRQCAEQVVRMQAMQAKAGQS
jgi:hypothetical protein